MNFYTIILKGFLKERDRIFLLGLQFQISLFRRQMFGPVDQSGGHESKRILGQSCSLDCFLQAWAGVKPLLSFSRFIGSIEVKKRFFNSIPHPNLNSLPKGEFSTKWSEIWCKNSFREALSGKLGQNLILETF